MHVKENTFEGDANTALSASFISCFKCTVPWECRNTITPSVNTHRKPISAGWSFQRCQGMITWKDGYRGKLTGQCWGPFSVPLPHHTLLEGNCPVNGSLVTSGAKRGFEMKRLFSTSVLVARVKYKLLAVCNIYPFSCLIPEGKEQCTRKHARHNLHTECFSYGKEHQCKCHHHEHPSAMRVLIRRHPLWPFKTFETKTALRANLR